MKLHQLFLIFLLPLTGCVSVGAGDYLVMPVGVVGVHSFAPQAAPIGYESVDVAAALREAARDDGAASPIRAVSSPSPAVRALDGA